MGMARFTISENGDAERSLRPSGAIGLEQVFPDLRAADGTGRLRAHVIRLPAGGLAHLTEPRESADTLGFLILKGLILREAAFTDRGGAAAELVGRGELVSAPGPIADGAVQGRARWTALENTWVADLGSLEPAGRREIAPALCARQAQRAERLMLERAICAHIRIDVRVLAYLWHLTTRFGTRSEAGIRLELPLKHAVLAHLVSAARPSVTTALQGLIREDYVRRDRRTFVLPGEPSAVTELLARAPLRGAREPGAVAQP